MVRSTEITYPDLHAFLKDRGEKAFNGRTLHMAPDIPMDKLKAALSTFANHLSPQAVVAYMDLSLFGRGEKAVLFTEEEMVYWSGPGSLRHLPLSGIQEMIACEGQEKDSDGHTTRQWTLSVLLAHGRKVHFSHRLDGLDRSPEFVRFLKALLKHEGFYVQLRYPKEQPTFADPPPATPAQEVTVRHFKSNEEISTNGEHDSLPEVPHPAKPLVSHLRRIGVLYVLAGLVLPLENFPARLEPWFFDSGYFGSWDILSVHFWTTLTLIVPLVFFMQHMRNGGFWTLWGLFAALLGSVFAQALDQQSDALRLVAQYADNEMARLNALASHSVQLESGAWVLLAGLLLMGATRLLDQWIIGRAGRGDDPPAVAWERVAS